MAADNDQTHKDLAKQIADLRDAHNALDQYVKAQPKPLTAAETSQIVDTRTAEQIERARLPRFSILGLNAGADQDGNLTFTGRGRLFLPFKEQFAIQMGGEYLYFRDRQEGQGDIGLVNRFATRGQAGLFASFKNVNFSGRNGGRNLFTDRPTQLLPTQFSPGDVIGNGTLGQGSFTLDYLFSRGKVGIFGSKGFLNDAVLNRIAISQNVFTEYYLRTIDQAGVSSTVGLVGNTYLEANIGYLKSRANADRVGGTARFIFPLSNRFAFTLEGGLNETMMSRENTGRVVAGFQFGNYMRPKDYLEGYNGVRHAVPVDVPRIRYEVLSRTVRTGNSAPVANPGPNQIGIPAGPVTLDASASYDPEGDPITYQWSQVAGPTVALSGMNTPTATFTAAEGQSYGFRLVVRDPQGLQGVGTVTITTTTTQAAQIVRFQAVPDRISAGGQSTLDWQVINADSVTISDIGNVPANGQRSVSPAQTTQYRLTARNARGEVSAVATVTVEAQAAPQFLTCTATPMNIAPGESSTISFATANATSVNISPGIGTVGSSGSQVVTPTQTTTYILTGTGVGGQSSCSVTVTVTGPQQPPPRIISFSANPTTITAGQTSTLTWSVENATAVDITGLGTVQAQGSAPVTPNATATFVITARNQFGTSQANATITVNPATGGGGNPAPAPTISACTASPATSPMPGTAVSIAYTTANATSVSFSPSVAGAGLQGPVSVSPNATTTYTITAAGTNNRTASCTVTVNVTPAPTPPTAIITGPSVVETIYRQVILDASPSTNPAGGALSYVWTPLSTGAAVLDQGQPQTRVQLGGAYGDYIFRVTVRNAQGQEASSTVTVRFKSTTVF